MFDITDTVFFKAPKRIAGVHGTLIIRTTTSSCKDGLASKKIILPSFQAAFIKTSSSTAMDQSTLYLRVDKNVARSIVHVENSVLASFPGQPEFPFNIVSDDFVSSVSIDEKRGHIIKLRTMGLEPSLMNTFSTSGHTLFTIKLQIVGLQVCKKQTTIIWNLYKTTPEFVEDAENTDDTDDEYIRPYRDDLLEDIRSKLEEQLKKLSVQKEQVEKEIESILYTVDQLSILKIDDLEMLRNDLLES